MRHIIASLIILSLFSCSEETKKRTLNNGTYRGILEVKDNAKLPFLFEVTSPTSLNIYNAEEVIKTDEIEYRNDSVFIKVPVFEGFIAAKFDGDNLNGNFTIESLDRVVPFSAMYNKDSRFDIKSKSTQNITGIWQTIWRLL